MSSPIFYYNGSPYAANIPLPPSPYASPRVSPYGVHIALPPSPMGYAVSLPLPASPHAPNPLPLPLPPSPHGIITPTNIATGTSFTPHPLLQLDAQDPSIKWDVRFPPGTARIAERPFPPLSKRHQNEPALSPPWTFMRLRSTLLPWLIEVSNPGGVTVADVLIAVHGCLRHRVEREEWRDQSREFQSRLLDAWKQRCDMVGREEGRAAREREEDRGVRRIDWLLYDVEWLGIQRSNRELETWDIHFRTL